MRSQPEMEPQLLLEATVKLSDVFFTIGQAELEDLDTPKAVEY